MKNYTTSVLSALAAFTVFAGVQARADNMASIAITPATGVVTLTPRWEISPNLAGFHYMSQDLGLAGGAATQFYSLKNTAIGVSGDTTAFSFYVAGSGFATNHADIGSKLRPNSYSALTSADPNIAGYGAVNLYMIHHKGTTDYLTAIIPSSAVASAVTDERPMSGPGDGGVTTGVSGYFGLTFASPDLGYGRGSESLGLFYYFRTVNGTTRFGLLDGAHAGATTDQFDLGISGHNALAFAGTQVGYGTDKMYYLRLDPITNFTIFGTLNPLTGRSADIANLGSVYSTLTFVAGDPVSLGANQFYTTGTVNPTWQSVSFAAIADRAVIDGSFTVHPTASSTLPIVLTVVTGSATISAPVSGVFTITPTAPGLITLQASQAGNVSFESNMLRQSFTVTGSVAHPDFNADGKADIIWQNTTTGQRTVWLMNGTTYLSGTSLATVPVEWSIAGSGDFNADGKSDIIWQNTSTGERTIWLMNGTTYLSGTSLATIPVEWSIAGSGDFNADGKSDIIWQNTSTGQRTIWLMNGTTYLSGTSLATIPVEWSIAN